MWSIKNGNYQIQERLLKLCGVNLQLNSDVRYIGASKTDFDLKNVLIYRSNGVAYEQSFDYIIFANPLSTNDDLMIDLDYSEYKNCEMKKVKTIFVHGELNLEYAPKNKPVNIFSCDPLSNFQSIESISQNLYKIVLSNGGTLDNIFTNYEIVKEFENEEAYPAYKKLEESHLDPKRQIDYKNRKKIDKSAKSSKIKVSTSSDVEADPTKKNVSIYPRIYMDSVERSRIFYLNSIEWLAKSNEILTINARNIALLISKKEQGSQITYINNGVYARSKRVYYNDICGVITSLSIFLLIFALLFKEPKMKNIKSK